MGHDIAFAVGMGFTILVVIIFYGACAAGCYLLIRKAWRTLRGKD